MGSSLSSPIHHPFDSLKKRVPAVLHLFATNTLRQSIGHLPFKESDTGGRKSGRVIRLNNQTRLFVRHNLRQPPDVRHDGRTVEVIRGLNDAALCCAYIRLNDDVRSREIRRYLILWNVVIEQVHPVFEIMQVDEPTVQLFVIIKFPRNNELSSRPG